MSTQNIYAAVLRLAEQRAASRPFRKHLDVGAGTGDLIRLMRERFKTDSAACDYTDQLMKVPGQRVEIANLNSQPLPYAAGSFDLLTATEVIEHLEHFRETIREFHRVLEPGGLCVVTTPNILNLNSRLRFLWFGYWNLFGPLPVKHSALYSTGGHINPVSYFYIAHALMDAGFEDIAWTVDKPQRSSMPKLVLLYPFIRLFGALAYRKEVNKYRTVDAQNAPFVQAMNDPKMLLGRTIVVSAVKPDGK
ncbi:MAG: class I SAM-dependent methyltransferase [Verrucomicrobia bacterium]|nr:class I SAM-dependent methyltransferase [Verrucomicrobiota bacterium]NBU10188.1 class I SAM-dependent methyltransferase [Pseudomonadota bacterium]NDA65487.1 class I SAM-dependent methyltransferase [Verrucomicrobiota bacterium]